MTVVSRGHWEEGVSLEAGKICHNEARESDNTPNKDCGHGDGEKGTDQKTTLRCW